MTQRVTVEVPATSANLGPGFDSLGVALDWALTLEFETHEEIQPAPDDPITAMAASAALTLFERAGMSRPAGLSVRYESDLPVGRGLGLSAAARVAGVLAANAMADGDHDSDALLSVVAQLERHADNAAPAMFGGLQVVVEGEERLTRLAIEPPSDLELVLLIPEFSMPTEETRRRLPERYTRNQAVHNIGRAALLIGALAQRRYELLRTATEDVLHQPARATIFEPMYRIFQAARDAGAHGVYLSGGGPTIAAFATERQDDIAGAMREAAAARGVEATTRVCGLRHEGARVGAVEGVAG